MAFTKQDVEIIKQLVHDAIVENNTVILKTVGKEIEKMGDELVAAIKEGKESHKGGGKHKEKEHAKG